MPEHTWAESETETDDKFWAHRSAVHHIHENKFLFQFENIWEVNVLYFNKISGSDFKMSQNFYISDHLSEPRAMRTKHYVKLNQLFISL